MKSSFDSHLKQLTLESREYLDVLRDIRLDDVVLDIGAHIGFFSAKAAKLAKEVVAVEPVPGNADLLRRNVGGFSNVQIIEAAISEEETVSLSTWKSTMTDAYRVLRDDALDEPQPKPNLLVQARGLSFENVLALHRFTVLKFDAELAEYFVPWRALSPSIRCLQIELHTWVDWQHRERLRVLSELEALGFKPKVRISYGSKLEVAYFCR
jgi:FkbM family methyltransferase